MPPAGAGSSGSSTTTTTAQRQPQLTPGQSTGGSTSPEMADVPDFDMGFDYESLGTETSPESMGHLPDQTPHYDQDRHHHHHPSHTAASNNQHLHLGPGLDFDVADFMNVVTASTHPSSAAALTPPPPTTNSFFASLFESLDAGDGTLTGGGASKLDIPPVPLMSSALVPRPPVRDLSLLRRNMACDGHDALAVHDPRSWMGYTVQALTSMHATFAQTRALPFVHPRLWAAHLPRPVLAVFSASTAYAHRSPHNRAWIMKLLADTAADVHRDGDRAAASAQDKLARVQALIILDSIRVFDGDVGLRAAAEREAHVLTAWIAELQQVVDALEAEAVQHAAAQSVPGAALPDGLMMGGGGSSPAAGAAYPARDRPPRSWDAWILLESARRTLLFACAFVCMTKLLKSLDVNQAMWQNLRFTASRHLWEAPSSVDFFRAWRDKPQYFIRDFDFKDFWSYARADDMDEFTKTMIMPQIGMDVLEHFMAGEDLSHVPPAA
ncbi:C6 zinc finger domain protein [Cordyceps militaris CM01]|uniref:C6 zinc finger domain protein n=1 Tax=Cordyceps militaris (strain CM01) TaxID=983644 RepID=G3JLL0_CORMM|nr:C6 zinc finger domain protein [Cordyceps militaris CM01]EGX90584.1 C6 zinc finger domain protein [Cordyceps militaris CM01]